MSGVEPNPNVHVDNLPVIHTEGNGMIDRRAVLLASLAGLAPWSTRAQTANPLKSSNAAGNSTTIRAGIALRAAFQSVIWIGVEAGIFKKHGFDMKLTLETGDRKSVV